MPIIIITTSGEVKLEGDVVGQIEWLRPFAESDVAGEYSQDDPFVDEWGCRIDCRDCDEKDDLLAKLKRAIERVAPAINDCRDMLVKMGLSDGDVSTRLAEIDALIHHMEFET